MKEYLFVLMFAVILMLIGSCKKNKEYFNPSIKSNKENFEPNCSSIYGKYNPRCNVHSNLYHVGYYNHRDQNYPILDMKNKDKKRKE